MRGNESIDRVKFAATNRWRAILSAVGGISASCEIEYSHYAAI